MDADRIAEQALGEGKPLPSGPHGIRLNNPGNIRSGPTPWIGQSGVDESGFCIFESAFYGIRALAKLLITYHDKYGLVTIRAIISRWAPSNENDTAAYIKAVCEDCSFGPDDWLRLSDQSVLAALTRAIIHHENGSMPYDDAEIRASVEAAL